MHGAQFYTPVKLVGYLVLLLMVAAIVWGAYITLTHWAGIGV
ncbi:MAG TPA: hypothetical protein VFP37_18510 [Steroidobacteraceae bacterium]|nr:hypothetical protein [Steroidobacteraceae bacterium]